MSYYWDWETLWNTHTGIHLCNPQPLSSIWHTYMMVFSRVTGLPPVMVSRYFQEQKKKIHKSGGNIQNKRKQRDKQTTKHSLLCHQMIEKRESSVKHKPPVLWVCLCLPYSTLNLLCPNFLASQRSLLLFSASAPLSSSSLFYTPRCSHSSCKRSTTCWD